MKNLLITFPHFSAEAFLKTESLKELEIITAQELASKGFRGIWRFIRKQKYERFIIGRSNLTEQEIKYFLEGILIFARAREKKIVDNEGRTLVIGMPHFLWDSMKFGLELIFDFTVIVATYIAFFLLFIFLKIPFSRNKDRGLRKIAFLRTDYFGSQREGGSFSHAQGFIEGVQAGGWEIFGLAQEKFFPSNIKFYKIPYVRFHNSPEIPEVLYNYKFIYKVLRILKREKPTFLYQRHSFLNIAGLVLKRILKIPLILEYNGSEPWIRETWGGKLFLKNLAYAFEKAVLNGADLIGVVSTVLQEELVKKGIARERIILNFNGVDTKKFRPDINGLEIRRKYGWGGKIVVGFLGSFGPWHGVEILAKAIKLVLEKNPNVHFLIMGDGALKPMVEKIIHDDGIKSAVTLPGTIASEKVPEYLAACDILTSPHIPNRDGTRFFGSPTKIFEYMAMGKAIVASNLEQIGEVLEDKKTALLVRPGDIQDLSMAILNVSFDHTLREKLGRNAREQVVHNYTWRHNAKRILTAFQGLIKDQ